MNVTEDRIDEIERAIREKIETKTGFGDEWTTIRKLQRDLEMFDSGKSGVLNFDEFFAALVRLNFVGVQREVEALFDRYDEHCLGTIDYKQFALEIFRVGQRPRLKNKAKALRDLVSQNIKDRSTVSSLHQLRRILQASSEEGYGLIDPTQLKNALFHFGVSGIQEDSVHEICDSLDLNQMGKVDVHSFMALVQRPLKQHRKELVKSLFLALDGDDQGVLRVDQVMSWFHASQHPDVCEGMLTEMEAREHVLDAFTDGEVSGEVTWLEFLQYFKDLSTCIQLESSFTETMQRMWRESPQPFELDNR